jgi:hypothetical protein
LTAKPIAADLARRESALAEAEARREAVAEKQRDIEQALASAPDWRSFADGRQRDQEYDRQAALRQQLQMLRNGTLFLAPGVTYEPPASLDQRIAELTERRDRAQRLLDGHVQQAERCWLPCPLRVSRTKGARVRSRCVAKEERAFGSFVL